MFVHYRISIEDEGFQRSRYLRLKCEFVRRCTHSEVILSRLADDFIARYSAKAHTHAEFFKEDAALACNQLTIYADECVQVMRQFDFLARGADIVSGLAGAALRLLDFLAKQVYHHLREAPAAPAALLQDSLCPSCCRLRENERVRSLREELRMGAEWEGRAARELVVRRGEKYDEEELLCESLEGLEVLNEEEIRKRLGKMEADHDKHKKEILVAVEELTRANERVSSYSRALEKSGKEFSGKFNVKDYVFQLGRHFCHNISSLDLKIRLLKQSLSPVAHQHAQTDHPVLLQADHAHLVAGLAADADRARGALAEALRSLTVEQNKNAELRQVNGLLQQKLQEGEVRREAEKIEEKVNEAQISTSLAAAEGKIGLLETLVRKLKTSKGKNVFIDSAAKEGEQAHSEDRLDSCREEPSLLKSHRNNTCKAATCPLKTKESILLNPKALLRLSLAKSNPGIKSATQQFTDRLTEMMPTAPELLAKICEEALSKYTLVATISESYVPVIPKATASQGVSRRVSKNLISSNRNCHESLHVSEAASRVDLNEKEERGRGNELEPIHHWERNKLSKVDLLRPNNHRDSIYIENELGQEAGKKKPTDRPLAFQDLRNTIDEKPRLPTKKMLGTLKTSLALQTFKSGHDKQAIKKQLAEKILLQKRNRHKKARNLSQENSYEHEEYQDLRRSIQKMEYKQRQCLGQHEKHLLLSASEGEAKLLFKSSIHRGGECARVVLSLEEINYSTYFYSLLAGIHLKSQPMYEAVRKFMVGLVPGLYEDDSSIKESLNCVLLAHRRCSSGPICHHLEAFLEKIRHL